MASPAVVLSSRMLFQESCSTEQYYLLAERHSKHTETQVVMAASCNVVGGAGDRRGASRIPNHTHEENGDDGYSSMNGDVPQRELPARPPSTRNPTITHEHREHSGSAAGYVYDGGREAEARFVDCRTTPIIRLLFHKTLTQANMDKEVIRRLDIEHSIRSLRQKDVTFVQETCDRYLEYIRNSEEVSVDSHLRGIETAGWDVSDNNVYVEFRKVVNETFDESVTWGGVVGFLGFALGFSVFIYNKGMKRAVVSVAEWTKQVIEDDIGSFFLSNNGWVGCVCVCVCVCMQVAVLGRK